VTVTEAVATDDELLQCVVILVLDVFARVQQVVAQSVELGEVKTKIGDLEQVLNFWAIGIVDGDERLQDTIDDFSTFRRFDLGISVITNYLINFLWRPKLNVGEGFFTVLGEVAVHCPGFTEVHRALNEHGGRSESFEVHDGVSELKLGFQIQLYDHVLESVFRLPPGLVVLEGADHILNGVRS